MRLGELPARDEDEQVMLEVIVHPVRRHEGARQDAGQHRASVPQRIVVLGGEGVLGDVADAADELIPRRERHEPQEQVEPPVAERGERGEEDGIGEERAAPYPVRRGVFWRDVLGDLTGYGAASARSGSSAWRVCR